MTTFLRKGSRVLIAYEGGSAQHVPAPFREHLGKRAKLLEDATLGGWDVYDLQLEDGTEASAYGFQLVWISPEYRRLRKAGWTASMAFRAASTLEAFVELLKQELVKIEVDPDDYDASYIDTWTDKSESYRERARKEVQRRLEQDGAWSVSVWARASTEDDFELVDSVGGFLGDDWMDSGYDVDLREAAIAWVEEEWERRAKDEDQKNAELEEIKEAADKLLRIAETRRQRELAEKIRRFFS